LQKQSDTSYRRQGPTQKRKAEQESTRIQSAIAITLFFGFSNGLSIHADQLGIAAQRRQAEASAPGVVLPPGGAVGAQRTRSARLAGVDGGQGGEVADLLGAARIDAPLGSTKSPRMPVDTTSPAPCLVLPVKTLPSAMFSPLPRQAPAGLRALTFLSGSCTSRSTRSRCPETMERTIQLVSQEGLPVARKVWQRVSPGWPCFAGLGSVRQFVHCTKMLKQASSPTSAASLCNWLRLLHDGSNLLPRPTESGRPGRV
jgi:hypothetical protein